MDTEDSLEKLKDVDKVLELVKKLSSSDSNVSQMACKEADSFLKEKCTNGFDKVVVNKVNKQSINPDYSGKTDDVTAFMSAVAQDAQERAQRRARQREEADKLKDRANTFFKAGNCKKAVDLYTKAIDLAKDYDILYTNRAQAYLRLGQPDLALKDCDTALLLFPEAPQLSPTGEPLKHNDNILSNPRLAKVHLHRGKALMSLNRPADALAAYSFSRFYSSSKNDKCVSVKPNEEKWPNYLVEYVAQAEAALAAQKADAEAEANFAESAIGFTSGLNDNHENISSSQQLLCLLAQLARRNQNSRYYSAGLRHMSRLFTDAPKSLPTTVNEVKTTNLDVKTESLEAMKHSPEKTKSNKKRKSSELHTSISEQSETTKTSTNHNPQTETLSDLQTIFRIKSGFTLLDKEVNVIYDILNLDASKQNASNRNCTQINVEAENVANNNESKHSMLDASERMLALLNLTNQLTIDCAENQRLLIERQPNLIKLALICLNMSSDFVQQITCSTTTTKENNNSSGATVEKQRSFHILGSLRLAACNLFVTLSSLPSGRQSLLDLCGSGPILTGLASCLSASVSSSQGNTSPSPVYASSLADAARGLIARVSSGGGNNSVHTVNNNNVDPLKCNSASSAMSVVCAAKAAQILEYLTESSRFLILARSSTDGLQGLLLIIESALASSSPTTPNQSSSTTCHCLATLLDSLGNACQDATFQKAVLQSRQTLLFGLADCLSRHTPLLNDPNHAHLIGSICRLLHNIYVGQLDRSVKNNNNNNNNRRNINGLSINANDTDEDCTTTFCLTSSKLINSILNGIGAILDKIGHGPELRAIAIALAGRLLPLCSHDNKQLSSWFGERTASESSVHVPLSDLPSRTRLLIAVLDSCSADSYWKNNLQKVSTNNQNASENTSESKGTNSISSHLINGCIRCLAAGTSHSISLRYIIGDDRRRVRRLARFIRVRLPFTATDNNRKSNTLRTPPRDEPLAGNVCLILQHCATDTPLAEHLQGTSVIYDLLSLIQESKRLDTKRNAAILVGKLAQSSQVHRDELSRLDGYSVLTPFNSWTATLERC
uniref:TPR_REGION domain-containing protein n=1 Tax=Trichobilharzia regenti TaxID=157069 RepID=A0AA85JC79_TRIRE|nr:unnamed protein product [Trichobilharzia regenti]